MANFSMPTGHRKWKCLVPQIRPAEEVALTALPGHSDAQRYYKITSNDKINDNRSKLTCESRVHSPGILCTVIATISRRILFQLNNLMTWSSSCVDCAVFVSAPLDAPCVLNPGFSKPAEDRANTE